MILTEIIVRLLSFSPQPLTVQEIADYVNNETDHAPTGSKNLTAPEIYAYVNNFPSIFQVFNGWVILSSDGKWRDLISAYSYIAAVIRGRFPYETVQLLSALLFFYKRLTDSELAQPYPVTICRTPISELNDTYELERWICELQQLDKINNLQVPLFSNLADLIRKTSPHMVDEIFATLNRLDTMVFTDREYAILFDYLIDVEPTAQERKSRLTRTPHPTIDLMGSLLNPKSGIVLDPVCGVGGLLANISHKISNVSVVGFEKNFAVALLGFMNLFLQTRSVPDLRIADCFNDLYTKQRFDYILADIPLMSIPDSRIFHDTAEDLGIRFPKVGRGFSAMLLFVYAKLNKRGKAVLTISDNFLSAGGIDEKMRDFLLNEDVIESVISLPANTLKPFTNGKASLLILNRSKPSYLVGKVKFIDATEVKYQSKVVGFDLNNIVNQYREKAIESKNVQIVDVEALLTEKTLQVAHFTERFHEIDELFRDNRAVLLKDLVEIRRGADLYDKSDAAHLDGTPFVKIENLERDILDMLLSSDSLQNHIQDTEDYNKALVDFESILIARIGENLKPTIFRPSRNIPSIIIHTNVLVLAPINNQKNFNFEYLYYQIYSHFVQKQVQRKRHGVVMPFISLKALNSLVIPFMDSAAQSQFVAAQKANIVAAERARVNERLKLIGFQDRDIQKEADIVSTLVHELRPKLVGMHIWAEKVARIIDRRKIGDLTEYDSVFDENFDPDLEGLLQPAENYTIGELTVKLGRDAEALSEVLRVVQNVMNFTLKKEDFVRTDITAFIKNYFSKRLIEIGDRFFWDVKGAEVWGDINCKSFEHILDQLVANALKHGFKTRSESDRIMFSVREDRERQIASIVYSNNGSPFRLTEEDFVGFFQKSKDSSGSGIGGNFVYRIVKAHGGEIQVSENTKRGFSMKIELPIAQGMYD
jgi:signal transduction histidine kinase